MALFKAQYSPNNHFNIRGVEAGDGPEMVSRLTNEVAAAVAASETGMVDLQIAGAGAGPQWWAWFVSADAASSGARVSYTPAIAFAASVAGNPDEAVFTLKNNIAALPPNQIYKIVVAGAGVGPTYMALAVYVPT